MSIATQIQPGSQVTARVAGRDVVGQVTSTAHRGTELTSVGFFSIDLGHVNRVDDGILVDAGDIVAVGGLDFLADSVLKLERDASGMRAGDKLECIRDLGLTEVAYYQRLNRLIDTEAAVAAYPVLVNRLRRQRAGSVRRRVHSI